jgi:trans-2,3-dihydro-3-hydroxyanthranilate isomerase
MAHHPYLLADVFTTEPFSGNPLAVFPEGDRVPPELMQRMARELNLSETVFVLTPADPAHTARLRIFTPGAELPFAGHPTVGTACLWAATGRATGPRITFEEGVGPVAVDVVFRNGLPFASFQVPMDPGGHPSPLGVGVLETLLCLPSGTVGWEGYSPGIWSCGVPFTVIPVRDREVLSHVRVDPAVWGRALSHTEAPHLFVVAPDPEAPTVLHARMFAPALGVAEDPATGAAAAALAGFLAAGEPGFSGGRGWTIRQGADMGRPSTMELEARLHGGHATAVRVGGATRPMGSGVMEIPDGAA